MKELDLQEAAFFIVGDQTRGIYDYELRSFVVSDARACELFAPNHVSIATAAESYRATAKRKNYPVKIMVRGRKIIAVKETVYDTLLTEYVSERYASKVMEEVKEIEELAKISGEYDY